MSLALRSQLWFTGTWFGCKALDSIVGYPDPIFNAALALMAMIACIAEHIEKHGGAHVS